MYFSQGGIPKRYPCSTQSLSETKIYKNKPTEINLGWQGIIPRWKAGSVVTWAANPDDYDSPADAAYAESQLAAAAEAWNALMLGVTFAKAPDPAKAVFTMQYNGDNGGTLAEAFFPNTKLTNRLFVYSRAFKADARGFMSNILQHELGHVLGLRHEFAAEEGDFVLFGSKNPASVMAYNWPPGMTEQDRQETREFYSWMSPEISSADNSYKVVDQIPRGGK